MNSTPKYHDYGLEIVGVHTPEYAFEHEGKNVQAGIENLGIKYPVVQTMTMLFGVLTATAIGLHTILLIVKVTSCCSLW